VNGPTMLKLRSLSEKSSLFPTGRCFDDALDYVMHVVGGLKNVATFEGDLYLVHAVCRWSGQPYAHAWAEHDGKVVEGKFLAGSRVYITHPKDEFYAAVIVDKSKLRRYSVREADRLNARYNHFGPWDPIFGRYVATSIGDFL